MTKPMNTYVPNFDPNNLPWYERDGLMNWYKKCRCDDFFVINFDIIHRESQGEMVPKDHLKYYQTVNKFCRLNRTKFSRVCSEQKRKIFF